MNVKSEIDSVQALIFELNSLKLMKSFLKAKITPKRYWKSGGPVSLKNVPYPKLIAEDWVIVKTVYCGICGSDMTELQL